ncbi:MAG: biopolymer transporter ExbB [Paracoccaceae bacterium]
MAPMRSANNPQMTLPIQPLVLILLVLAGVGAGIIMVAPQLMPIFLANVYINGFIALVFLFGVAICLYQLFSVILAIRWANATPVFTDESTFDRAQAAPRLLQPLANLLRELREGMKISNAAATAILESIASRIEEGREISRYVVNLMIYLGLLGTFYGLATTVPALVETIKSLSISADQDGADMFAQLINGLEGQLSGMGVAFASSLLGLAGSLVVGLLEIFVSHGQNRFYRELEEWISSITRLSYSEQDAEGQGGVLIVAGVLERMNEQLNQFTKLFATAEQSRTKADMRMAQLQELIMDLVRHLEASSSNRESTQQLITAQHSLADAIRDLDLSEGFDAESRMRLRSIDIQVLRLLEELSSGRHDTLSALRSDIQALIATISAQGRG